MSIAGKFFTHHTWSACCWSCGTFIDIYEGGTTRLATQAAKEMHAQGWKKTRLRGWECPTCPRKHQEAA